MMPPEDSLQPEGRRILADAKLDFIVAEGMQDAAAKAVAAVGEQA